jgi:glycerol kinase
MDTWLIWNLSGRSAHVTDVTNASRTMLMDIRQLNWDPYLLHLFDVPLSILPQIRSSAEPFGRLQLSRLAGSVGTPRADVISPGVPITGCLGDQQAALLGQHCLAAGQAKATYGTGCFLLANTGTAPVISDHGLLATVAFRLGPAEPAFYALEGSIGQAGAALNWLRSVGIATEVGAGASAVGGSATHGGGGDAAPFSASASAADHNSGAVCGAGGVQVVPAFGGLLAPRWRPDARATITGTRYRHRLLEPLYRSTGTGSGIYKPQCC